MNETTTPVSSSAMQSVVKAVVKATPAKKPAVKKSTVAKPAAKKAAPAKTTAVKKPAPAKKAAPKAATPAHRIDYKVGTRVKVTRRGQDEPSKGFVTRVFAGKTGHFIEVNIGSKAKPEMLQARPAKVRGF